MYILTVYSKYLCIYSITHWKIRNATLLIVDAELGDDEAIPSSWIGILRRRRESSSDVQPLAMVTEQLCNHCVISDSSDWPNRRDLHSGDSRSFPWRRRPVLLQCYKPVWLHQLQRPAHHPARCVLIVNFTTTFYPLIQLNSKFLMKLYWLWIENKR